jgi:hypothetical protein
MTVHPPKPDAAKAQAERFRALAKEVGADKSDAGLAEAVRKLAASGPVGRKPLKARKPKR